VWWLFLVLPVIVDNIGRDRRDDASCLDAKRSIRLDPHNARLHSTRNHCAENVFYLRLGGSGGGHSSSSWLQEEELVRFFQREALIITNA